MLKARKREFTVLKAFKEFAPVQRDPARALQRENNVVQKERHRGGRHAVCVDAFVCSANRSPKMNHSGIPIDSGRIRYSCTKVSAAALRGTSRKASANSPRPMSDRRKVMAQTYIHA